MGTSKWITLYINIEKKTVSELKKKIMIIIVENLKYLILCVKCKIKNISWLVCSVLRVWKIFFGIKTI